MAGDLKIFSGRSNEPLARAIVEYIGSRHASDVGPVALGRLDERRRNFSDGELYVRLMEGVRGADVFIVQSTDQPDSHAKELRRMISAAVCASAFRVTAVLPYFGYARQDCKDKPHAVVSAVEETREIIQAGANRLLVLDVHSSAVENAAHYPHVPCDHLLARPSFLEYLRADEDFLRVLADNDLVVAGPDLNAGKLARKYAEAFGNIPIVLAYKVRDLNSGDTELLSIIGEVADKNVLIVDDMIDTAGTLCKAAAAFREMGAKRIFALATHGVFSTDAKTLIDARTLIENSVIERVFITDSILQKDLFSKVEIMSSAPLFGEAIFRIHTNQSVSSLFEE